MTTDVRPTLAELHAEILTRLPLRRLHELFPAEGPRRRELYPRQMLFFALGATHTVRAFMAGNRIGKSTAGGYETALHLTGLYPDWWTGRRFTKPILAWASGKTLEKARDIVQRSLLGPQDAEGTGLIPGHHIVRVRYRANTNGAADFAIVRHVSGGLSRLAIKSYDQGRKAYEGDPVDWIWNDEEPHEDVRGEEAMRLVDTGGAMIETFTPLDGLTPVVLKYVGEEGEVTSREMVGENRAMVMAGWADVPHLGERERTTLLAECEPHLVKARSEGIPNIGEGAVYPIEDEELRYDDFPIPDGWARAFALDVGWKRTAALWGAHDRDTDTVYLYAEYYRAEAQPDVHAADILAKGKWIPGFIDPASRGRSQADGRRLRDDYVALGLQLEDADNAREAGTHEVWVRMISGRFKVARSLTNWWVEKRLYRRDDKGRIVKMRDHLMDDTRYLIASIGTRWKTQAETRVVPTRVVPRYQGIAPKHRWAS